MRASTGSLVLERNMSCACTCACTCTVHAHVHVHVHVMLSSPATAIQTRSRQKVCLAVAAAHAAPLLNRTVAALSMAQHAAAAARAPGLAPAPGAPAARGANGQPVPIEIPRFEKQACATSPSPVTARMCLAHRLCELQQWLVDEWAPRRVLDSTHLVHTARQHWVYRRGTVRPRPSLQCPTPALRGGPSGTSIDPALLKSGLKLLQRGSYCLLRRCGPASTS